MLRRSQDIIDLPKRKDIKRPLQLNLQEQEAYDIIKKKAIETLDNALSLNKPHDVYRNTLEKINALRMICETGCFERKTASRLHWNSSYSSAAASVKTSHQSTPTTPGADSDEEVSASASDMEAKLEEFCSPVEEIGAIFRDLQYLNTLRPGPNFNEFPTKIKALVQDIQTCAIGTKRYIK